MAPGSRTSPGFGAPNVTVRSARTAGPSTAPVSPFTPEGMSTATSGSGDAASAPIACGVRPRRGSAEARPEDRVDRHVGALELAVERRRLERATPHRRGPEPCEVRPRGTRERLVQEQHGGADARAVQVPGRDEAVATVVALAAHHDRAPPVRAADQPDGGVGDLAAGGLHQRVRGDPSLLGRAIELGRLRGVRIEPHASRPHPDTATAKATALVFSWVNVISTSEIPSASARAFALPSSRIDGAPEGALVTEMSCHRLPR